MLNLGLQEVGTRFNLSLIRNSNPGFEHPAKTYVFFKRSPLYATAAEGQVLCQIGETCLLTSSIQKAKPPKAAFSTAVAVLNTAFNIRGIVYHGWEPC